ncbi:MAG TPA: VOC family protein [Acidimicrobiales bacterium]|nr:VOC family protein [Acidimicrobiales bacterium]
MNPVVHFELFAKDAPALGAFYAELFGWSLQDLPDIRYVLIDTRAGAGSTGGILTVPDGWRQPMFYVSVDDLQPALDRVERAGGATTLPPITEVVSFAQFSDPEGNVLGLLKRGDEPSVSRGDAPPVSRFHIRSTGPAELVDFYRTVFGWRARRSDVRKDAPIFEVETGSGGICGSIGSGLPGASAVVFYASVAAPGTYLDRARAQGGASVGPTRSRPGAAEATYVVDPEGQSFGLLTPTSAEKPTSGNTPTGSAVA